MATFNFSDPKFKEWFVQNGEKPSVKCLMDIVAAKQQDTPREVLEMMWQWYQEDTASKATLPADEITERFLAFHEANPWVYKIFETWALEDYRSGHPHGAIEKYVNELRWNARPYAIQRTSDVAEIPNEFKSRYSRLIMARNPELVGFFRTKKLKAV